jgi:purine-nucleoside phosphorylase
MHDISERINEAYKYLIQKMDGNEPELGLILGSGLGVLADEIKEPICIPYGDIPMFPVSTVEGHSGQLVIGKLEGKTVLAMQGRFHYYEGYSMQEITIPVRVMSKLGINKMIITNAAGGVNETFKAGDLMIINDHINFSGDNPLIGPNLEEFGPRFPDMSNPYNEDLISVLKNVARELNIELKEGVYFYSQGPSYETPAEVNMARVCGADAVGMSTVPEVIVGVHAGMKILGISCITNMASGILDQPLDHEEVMETAGMIRSVFISLIKQTVSNI